MVQLIDKDIKTREVKEWSGLHLLHFIGSSCSQKVRIMLNLTGVKWHSHPVNLIKQEHLSEWYLGINPRGLVPCLIHNGDVHIESNDILIYIDKNFNNNKLIPHNKLEYITKELKFEDDLHLDLRALTFRFTVPSFLGRKDPKLLELLEKDRKVRGQIDNHKKNQLAFWKSYEEQGINDEQARISISKFKEAFKRLEQNLKKNDYLLGKDITVLDIAWFIYVNRLGVAGYPFQKEHPNLYLWFRKLFLIKEFAKETIVPFPVNLIGSLFRATQIIKGNTIKKIASF